MKFELIKENLTLIQYLCRYNNGELPKKISKNQKKRSQTIIGIYICINIKYTNPVFNERIFGCANIFIEDGDYWIF